GLSHRFRHVHVAVRRFSHGLALNHELDGETVLALHAPQLVVGAGAARAGGVHADAVVALRALRRDDPIVSALFDARTHGDFLAARLPHNIQRSRVHDQCPVSVRTPIYVSAYVYSTGNLCRTASSLGAPSVGRRSAKVLTIVATRCYDVVSPPRCRRQRVWRKRRESHPRPCSRHGASVYQTGALLLSHASRF